MGKSEYNIHYVSTLDEAARLISRRKRFWISNCGCRESRQKPCKRSRLDVCLYFTDTFGSTGTGFRRVTPREAKTILKEAQQKFLVARPFRDPENKNAIDGICFCCNCCCWYFVRTRGSKYRCDKGSHIEKTDFDKCSACGSCVGICYFKARRMKKNTLKVLRGKCYGCGLCVEMCRQNAITMTKR